MPNPWEMTDEQLVQATRPRGLLGALDAAEAFGRGFVEGIPVTGPWMRRGADWIGEQERGLLGIDADPDRHERLSGQHPIADTLGNVAGGIAGTSAMIPAAPAAFGAGVGQGLLSRLAFGGASGAVENALDTASRQYADTGELDPEGIATSAAIGTAGGALGGALSRPAARGGARYRGLTTEATPGALDLKNQAQALYKQADDAGLVLSRDAVRQMHNTVTEAASKAKYDPDFMPGLKIAMKRLKQAGEGGRALTLSEVDGLRQKIGNALASDVTNANQRRVAGTMLDAFDDWFGGLADDAVVSGDRDLVSKVLPKARSLWRRTKKTEIIEEALAKAEDVAGGPTHLMTSVKARLRNVKNRKDYTKIFNSAERKAIESVIRADGAEQAASAITTLTGIFTGGSLGAALGGSLIGGPIGMAAGGAAGLAASGATRHALGRRSLAKALEAQHLIATGRPLVRPTDAGAALAARGVLGGLLMPDPEERNY